MAKHHPAHVGVAGGSAQIAFNRRLAGRVKCSRCCLQLDDCTSVCKYRRYAQRSETHRRLRLRRSRKRLSQTFRRFDGSSEMNRSPHQRFVSRWPRSGSRSRLWCSHPVARDLTALRHAVVGVDGSAQQVARARRNLPKATLIKADMCEVAFEVGSFNAVRAFYSITHVPRTYQGPLIANIAAWLKPGGTFVAALDQAQRARGPVNG